MFIKPEDLKLHDSIKFIDVRSPDVYANYHLNNAINMPDLFTYLLPRSSKEAVNEMYNYFQKRFSELGITGKEHIVIYEQSMDNQYGASCRGFFIFKYMKHPYVSTLEGGLDALIRLDGNMQMVTNSHPIIVPCEYCGYDDSNVDSLMADCNDVLKAINNQQSGTYILDVRDAIEWNGLSSSPYGVNFTPRKGRIPNSVWIEWYQFHELDTEKQVIKSKTNEQIRALMTQHGIQSNDEVIIYCFKGSRASVAFMKLKEAGYNNVKNYFASWNEWSRDFQLPIDDKILDENSE